MRRFRQVVSWLLGALVLTMLVLALSIPLDAFLTRNDVAALTNTSISSTIPFAPGEIKAYVVGSEAAKQPTIIMIHEFWGLRPDIIGKANALAEAGYLVVAPDTFRGQTTAWLPRAIWQTVRQPEKNLLSDLDAVYSWLGSNPQVDPERIMVMGFCYGGGAALKYSLTNPELSATGIFYGRPMTDIHKLRALPGPVLGIFGEEDASIPVAEVQAFDDALTEAGVPHEIQLYPNVGHAFVGSIEDIRAGGEDAEAWQTFLTFAAVSLQN